MSDTRKLIKSITLTIQEPDGRVYIQADSDTGSSVIGLSSDRPIWLKLWCDLLATIITERA